MSEESLERVDKPYLGLRWLIRLRWLAVTGQIATCVVAAQFLGIILPIELLSFCFLITLGTNTLLVIFQERLPLPQKIITPLVLALDTGMLTVMLYWTGGAHNPFSLFYLLHVVIAAILLPQLWSAGAVILCGGCYGLLFLSPHALTPSLGGMTCCGSFDFHLQGMFVALLIVGACIAFFVGQLSAALGKREAELNAARRTAARHERFAALATLAAGVAHELATPLSTIAVASNELERQAGSFPEKSEFAEDARLIRTEVERCRGIIEKLGNRAANGYASPFERTPVQSIPELLRDYLKQESWARIRFENQSASPEVTAPQSALLQSLSVLIKNACEASAPDQSVQLIVQDDAEGMWFCVRDSGEGMTPDVLSSLGEPFFTTKVPGSGMGLGLFLVRTFVERIHGRLDVNSVPGKGTSMSLLIPRKTPRDDHE